MAEYRLLNQQYSEVDSLLGYLITRGIPRTGRFDEKLLGPFSSITLASCTYFQSVDVRARLKERHRMKCIMVVVILLEAELNYLLGGTNRQKDNSIAAFASRGDSEKSNALAIMQKNLIIDNGPTEKRNDLRLKDISLTSSTFPSELSPLSSSSISNISETFSNDLVGPVSDSLHLQSECLLLPSLSKFPTNIRQLALPSSTAVPIVCFPSSSCCLDHNRIQNIYNTISASEMAVPSSSDLPFVVDLPPGVNCEIIRFLSSEASLNQIPRSQQRWKAVGQLRHNSLDALSRIVDLLIECLQAHLRLIKRASLFSSGSHADAGGGATPSFVMLHRVTRLITVALHSAVITIAKQTRPILPWSGNINSDSVTTRFRQEPLIDLRLFRQFAILLSTSGIPMTDEPRREYSAALTLLGASLFVPELPELSSQSCTSASMPQTCDLQDFVGNSQAASSAGHTSEGIACTLVTPGKIPSLPEFDCVTGSLQSLIKDRIIVTAVARISTWPMEKGQFALLPLRVEFVTPNSVRVLGLHSSVQNTVNVSSLKALVKSASKENESQAKKDSKSNAGSADVHRRKRTNLREVEGQRKRQKKSTETLPIVLL